MKSWAPLHLIGLAPLGIAELMKQQRMSKAVLAKRVKTNRAALYHLLDDTNTAVTLQTMGRAAAVLGQELTITLHSAA